MNSPVKLDSCLHIRFSMSALKGKAAEKGARAAVCECVGQGTPLAWLLVPTVFVTNGDVGGLATLPAHTVAVRLLHALSSFNSYLLFMPLVF